MESKICSALMRHFTNRHPRVSYILESPNCYACWKDFERDVEAVARLGYEGLELQLRSPDELLSNRIGSLLENCGLRLVGVQTGAAYVETGVCLASADRAVRAAAEDLLKRYIELATRFGAIVVFGYLQGTREEEPDCERALVRIRQHLAKVAEVAETAGVLVAIEPVNRYERSVFHNTVADVMSSIEQLGSPALRAMVDTFHVNIEETSQRAAIQAAAPLLAHVHLSETNRGLFGTGHLDLPSVFEALHEVGYASYVSIGVYRDEPPVAERAHHSMKKLREIWNGAHR